MDIDEKAIAQYPSVGNVSMPEQTYDYQYVYARHARSQWLSGKQTPPPVYRPGHIF
jgi:hypothetical protein